MPPQIPSLQPLIDATNALTEALKSVTDAFKAIADVVKTIIDPFKDITTGLKELAKALVNELKPAFADIKSRISGFVKTMREGLGMLFDMLPSSVQKFILNMGSLLGDGFSAVGEKIGVAFRAVSKAFSTVAMAAGEVAGALFKFGEAAAQLVKFADPATFQLFQRAMEDVSATLGRVFAPTLELVTQVTRVAADVVMGLAPAGQSVATALKPLVAILKIFFEMAGREYLAIGRILNALAPSLNALGQVLVQLMKAVQPLFDVLTDVVAGGLLAVAEGLASVLQELLPYIITAARLTADLMKSIADGIREILSELGLNVPNQEGFKAGSSVGAAVRGTNIGSVSSVNQAALKSAFSLGSAANSPENRTATAAEQISAKAELIYNEIKTLPARLAEQLAQWAAQQARAATNFAGNAGSSLEEFGRSLLARANF